MHIPQSTTHAIEVEPFDSALAAALQPAAEYDLNRWLYVPHH